MSDTRMDTEGAFCPYAAFICSYFCRFSKSLRIRWQQSNTTTGGEEEVLKTAEIFEERLCELVRSFKMLLRQGTETNDECKNSWEEVGQELKVSLEVVKENWRSIQDCSDPEQHPLVVVLFNIHANMKDAISFETDVSIFVSKGSKNEP